MLQNDLKIQLYRNSANLRNTIHRGCRTNPRARRTLNVPLLGTFSKVPWSTGTKVQTIKQWVNSSDLLIFWHVINKFLTSLILITIIKIEIIMFDASRIYHLNLYTNHLRRYSLTVIIFCQYSYFWGFFSGCTLITCRLFKNLHSDSYMYIMY